MLNPIIEGDPANYCDLYKIRGPPKPDRAKCRACQSRPKLRLRHFTAPATEPLA